MNFFKNAARFAKVMSFLEESSYKIPKEYQFNFSLYLKGYIVPEKPYDINFFNDAIDCYNRNNDETISINEVEYLFKDNELKTDSTKKDNLILSILAFICGLGAFMFLYPAIYRVHADPFLKYTQAVPISDILIGAVLAWLMIVFLMILLCGEEAV